MRFVLADRIKNPNGTSWARLALIWGERPAVALSAKVQSLTSIRQLAQDLLGLITTSRTPAGSGADTMSLDWSTGVPQPQGGVTARDDDLCFLLFMIQSERSTTAASVGLRRRLALADLATEEQVALSLANRGIMALATRSSDWFPCIFVTHTETVRIMTYNSHGTMEELRTSSADFAAAVEDLILQLSD